MSRVFKIVPHWASRRHRFGIFVELTATLPDGRVYRRLTSTERLPREVALIHVGALLVERMTHEFIQEVQPF